MLISLSLIILVHQEDLSDFTVSQFARGPPSSIKTEEDELIQALV